MDKQDPTVEVSADEYYAAAQRWFDFWHQHNPQHRSNFARFLGMTNVPIKARELPGKKGPLEPHFVVQVRQSAARKIKLLNSPHYHTLLTAYKIRKNIDAKETTKPLQTGS